MPTAADVADVADVIVTDAMAGFRVTEPGAAVMRR
jgi:hypothetical protein